MNAQPTLKHEFVKYIPDKPREGILYISREYKTATHLCCCGCGLAVVTPLNSAKWSISDHGNSVSLYPSIGNWSFPCKSHYWIDHGRVKWARHMSVKQISMVRVRDKVDAEKLAKGKAGKGGLLGWIRHWFG